MAKLKIIVLKCNRCEQEFIGFLVTSDKCPSLVCPEGLLSPIEEDF